MAPFLSWGCLKICFRVKYYTNTTQIPHKYHPNIQIPYKYHPNTQITPIYHINITQIHSYHTNMTQIPPKYIKSATTRQMLKSRLALSMPTSPVRNCEILTKNTKIV